MAVHEKLEIKDLVVDSNYVGILMVKSIEPKDGKLKPYYRMILSDGSVDIEGTCFEDISNHKALVGKIILVTLHTQLYNGKFCCVVKEIDTKTPLPDGIKDKFIKFSSDSTHHKQCQQDLITLVQSIKDQEIKGLCEFVFLDKYKSQFETIPAGKSNHHTGCGGLLEHSLSLAKLGLMSAEYYSYDYEFDNDLIIAGALFQDIGKVFEFDVDDLFNVKYSKLAALKGHVILGDEILYDSIRELEFDPNQDKFARLSHIILSHQSLLEYGSPVLPCIPEAVLISKLDKLDSELKSTFSAIKATREEEDFSARLMSLNNAAVLLPTTQIYKIAEKIMAGDAVGKEDKLDGLFS